MNEGKWWPTPAVNDMGESKSPAEWDAWTAAMRERHGNGNGHGPSLSIEARRDTPSSTSLPATGDSPSPLRLWPTPCAQEDQKSPEAHMRMKANMPGGPRSTITSLTVMVKHLHSAPSASRRSSPMPVPCSPIGSLVSPTSAPFSRSPEIAYFASAVSSRLSSLAAFLASPTATPGSDSPARTSATSGPNVGECFGSYVPASRSSRTSPGCCPLSQDFFSTEFCRTWPNSGTLAAGKLYQRPTLERPIDGSASGSSVLTSEAWLTPRANEPEDDPGFVARNGDRGAHCSGSLGQQVKKEVAAWPTPAHRDFRSEESSEAYTLERESQTRGKTLTWAIKMECSGPPPTASGPPDPVKRSTSGSPAGSWATPTAMDDREATGMRPSRLETNRTTEYLHRQVNTPSGKLNPSWVETLMGLPLGWTQLPRKFVKPKAVK